MVLLSATASDARPLISLDDCERLAATVERSHAGEGVLDLGPGAATPGASPCTWTARPGRTPRTSRIARSDQRAFPWGTRRAFRCAPTLRTASAWWSAVSCCALPGANQDAVQAAATEALIGGDGLFGARTMAIGQRLYRSQVESCPDGRRGHRRARPARSPVGPVDGSAETDPDEVILDPGQDGYFSLPSTGLTISVVTR